MKSITCLLAMWSACSLASADDAAVQRCRFLDDSAARLNCYDAMILSAPSSVTAALGGKPPVSASPHKEANASSGPMAATSLVAAFGFDNGTIRARSVEVLESSIKGQFLGWVARSRFPLANGQVWEVSDGSEAAYDLRDLKVRLVRGISGSFFIQIEGVSQTPRVRRVQ